MISSPTARPRSPSAAHGCTSSQASGAPSDPCRGALLRALSTDRITPTGRSRGPIKPARILLALMWPSPAVVLAITGYVGRFACVLNLDDIAPGIGLAAVEIGEAIDLRQLPAG